MATKLPRKTKATPKTIEIIFNAIADGLTQRDASILAGISEDTLSLWKRQDSDFSEQIRQKEIEYKQGHVQIINKEAKKNWKASAWLLERKYKNEYSPHSKIDLGHTESLQELGDMIKRVLTPKKVN